MDFALDRLPDCFTPLLMTAGQTPLALARFLASLDEQKPIIFPDDGCHTDGGAQDFIFGQRSSLCWQTMTGPFSRVPIKDNIPPMCGRYSITTPTEALRQLFDFSGHPNLGPNYNVAPTSIVPLVRMGKGGRELAMARWGFIPDWAKEVRSKPLINARAETIQEKPSFRGAFKYRRCLVPADGYFEWHKQPDGSKQPWYIYQPDREPFGMAAIRETYLDPDGTEIDTLAILTSAANKTLAPLHHRMPVVIEPGHFDRWLTSDPKQASDLTDLLKPGPEGLFTAHPVGARVGRVGEDDPDIIKPVGPALDSAPPSPEKDADNDQLSFL